MGNHKKYGGNPHTVTIIGPSGNAGGQLFTKKDLDKVLEAVEALENVWK